MGFFSRDLYASKAASIFTSEVYNVKDAAELTLFLRGSPSTTTVQGSNADGRLTDITNTTTDWSDLTVITSPSPDMLNIEPGFAYIRLIRSETTEALLAGRYDYA
jgi:hypothetical protein